ncbi:rhodanese-like domain-containing protein [Bradyrhizobium erythrophlei]|uniref:rhodanese-like domain-containing protein n=1 Tax=Bradyrhizobium erythrophlei TaxID=1437360 RepID=UPI0035EC096E
MTWKRCASVICAMLAMAALVSSARAQEGPPPEPKGYWQGPMNGRLPATIAGGTVIATQELAGLLGDEATVLIDVSPAPRRPEHLSSPWLPMPHRTIPRSVWIPGAGTGVISAAMTDYIRTRLTELTEGNRDRSIVVYCRADCWASWNAAKRLISEGYRHVAWYPHGIEAWRDSGLPTAVTEPEGPASQ